MKKSSILILATNFPSIKIFTWFFFKNPNTFQTRFSQIRNQIKKLIPEISPMIIDQSKLSSNRSPTSNLLRISLLLSLDSHTTTHSPPTHSNNFSPGTTSPFDEITSSFHLSLLLSPFFLNSRAQPRGDRRVSVRSTLPFIRPSPVSSGLTSPSSLCVPTSCLWWPHVARSREKGQPCPDLLLTLVDLRAYYYAYVAQLRWHAPNPRKRSFTRCCSSAYLLLVPE